MRLIGLFIAALSLSSIAFAGSHAKPVGPDINPHGARGHASGTARDHSTKSR
jgi:hypothetical protein